MSKPSLFSSPWSTNLQALGTKRRISTQVGIDAFQVPRRFLPARDLRRHQVPVPSDRLHHAALSPPIESPAKHDIPGRNEPVVLLLLVIIIIVLVVSKYVEIVDFLHEILLGLFLLSLRGVGGGGVSILVVTNGIAQILTCHSLVSESMPIPPLSMACLRPTVQTKKSSGCFAIKSRVSSSFLLGSV